MIHPSTKFRKNQTSSSYPNATDKTKWKPHLLGDSNKTITISPKEHWDKVQPAACDSETSHSYYEQMK